TVAGIGRAVGAGIRHVEHVKRYTVIGTGIDQARSGKTNAGAITALLTDRPVADVGVSGGRPPVEPLLYHLLGGRAERALFAAVRTPALHPQHVAEGAVFEPSGQWLRPNHFPRPGESMADAVRRECRAARTGVAVMDVSTLGKIDVQGPDAVWFLEQIYAYTIGTIPVGKARYSVMCRLDGSVLDDGLVMRTGDRRFFITASTGHAAAVLDWMEEWLQTEWAERRVFVTSLTEQLTTIALVGPRSREAMARIAPALDVSKDALPFLAVRTAAVAGIPDAQVARVSFSGELAYEISVPWDLGPGLWTAVRSAGGSLGITPYGLETLQVLRAEKGYVIVGQDTESTTTPFDARLGWLVAKQKALIRTPPTPPPPPLAPPPPPCPPRPPGWCRLPPGRSEGGPAGRREPGVGRRCGTDGDRRVRHDEPLERGAPERVRPRHGKGRPPAPRRDAPGPDRGPRRAGHARRSGPLRSAGSATRGLSPWLPSPAWIP